MCDGCGKFSGFAGEHREAFRIRPIAVLAVIAIIILTAPASAGDTSRTVLLHGGDWDTLKLNNAIFSYILKNGYGYETIVVPGPEKTVAEQLMSGEIDISLEVWMENHPPTLRAAIDAGKIIDTGRIYNNASHTYIIPRHIAEQYNISSMEEMKNYWSLCKDPEDPSRGLFYTGIISWWSHDITLKKMDEYRLSPYYNPITMPSGRSYEAVFMRAAEQNRTVFGLYWTPSSVTGTGYWKTLTEPVNPSCLQSMTGDPDTGITPRVCPFQESGVNKLVFPGILSRNRDIVPVITAYAPGEAAISRILAAGYLKDEHDWNILAEQYLRENREIWPAWVSPEANRLISDALGETGEDRP